jgi:predicted DNA-binding transcriptional regulator AlpA
MPEEPISHNATGERIAGPHRAPAELLDIRTVADMVGASTRHIDRLSKARKMPRPFKLGALVRWSRREIEQWIATGCPAFTTKKGA